MWAVQISFLGEWVTLASDFKTKGEAEWIIAEIQMEMNCTGDSLFRTVENPLFEGDDTVSLVAEPASGEPITDEMPVKGECERCKLTCDDLRGGICGSCGDDLREAAEADKAVAEHDANPTRGCSADDPCDRCGGAGGVCCAGTGKMIPF